MKEKLPTIHDVLKAQTRIKKFIHRTPVLRSSSLDAIAGGELFFKCENFQKAGAFKFRGACNAVFSLSDDEAGKGVATHSSGNHAAALSLAARIRGVRSYVVMPDTAPSIKKKAVEGYGAEITFCKPTLEDREKVLAQIIEKTGATFIHPYNNFLVICGQGTAAMELLEEIPEPDMVLTPVGGGGLTGGAAIVVKSVSPKTKMIAVEPCGADDAFRSFRDGKIYPSVNPKTIADGLLTCFSPLTFSIAQKYVDDIVPVSEEGIILAMRMIWERMKIIIEPSSAVPLAAILEKKIHVAGKRIGIILSGGNVDIGRLPFNLYYSQI